MGDSTAADGDVRSTDCVVPWNGDWLFDTKAWALVGTLASSSVGFTTKGEVAIAAAIAACFLRALSLLEADRERAGSQSALPALAPTGAGAGAVGAGGGGGVLAAEEACGSGHAAGERAADAGAGGGPVRGCTNGGFAMSGLAGNVIFPHFTAQATRGCRVPHEKQKGLVGVPGARM